MQITDNQGEKFLSQEFKRLIKVKEYLQYSFRTDKSMAEAIGYSQSYLSEILSGRKNIPKTLGKKLEDNIGISRVWFETGKGEMLISKKDDLLTFSEATIEYSVSLVKTSKVPIYDMEFAANVMSNLIEIHEEYYPVGYLSLPEVQGCDFIIRAKGDSMAPKINDQDWIGLKRMNNWKEWFPLGYIYAIVTDDTEFVKYIKKGKTPETFKIESHNKFYEDDELPKHLIRELWSVKIVMPGTIRTLM